MKRLINLRSELVVKKSQYNSFGKYNYRSCEDILEAVKPLLMKHDLFMELTDELVNIGERYYIKAIVTVTDGEKSSVACGWSREALNKKGMDESQITGSTSSYARKRALDAMFQIDDTKDADTDEQHKQTKTDEQINKNNKTDFDRNVAIKAIKDYMQTHGATMEYRATVERDFDNAVSREDFNVIRSNVVKELKNDSGK